MSSFIEARGDPFVRALALSAAASVAFWGFVLVTGFHLRPGTLPDEMAFKTYFQALNWVPFPAFFLILIPAMVLTWQGLGRAWIDLGRTGVLLDGKGGRPSPAACDRLAAAITWRRWWACAVALVAAVAINGADLAPTYVIFLGAADGDTQLAYACARPDVWTKWVWETLAAPLATPCDGARRGLARVEPDWQNLAFWLGTSIQQTVIVFFVSLIIAQVLLHTLLFGWFRRFLPECATELRIRLNPTSPVNEFGLEHWNYVLNNLYWMACPVLAMVFLSRSAVDPESYQAGQHLLGVIVPAVLLLPMVVTILARQAWLPDLWPELEGEAAEGYSRQQLWPLDRNWSSKLGIILAFTLAALSLGYEVSALLGVTG